MIHQLSWDELLVVLHNGKENHVVKFYEGEKILCDSITEFIYTGLENEEGVLAIPSFNHIQPIEKGLLDLGVNLDEAKNKGQLCILSAEDCLSKFMNGNLPDKNLFNELVDSILDKTMVSYPVVRAYGEMVNLLQAQENEKSALALETLWDNLAETRTFSLLCGYTLETFNPQTHEEIFKNICQVNSYSQMIMDNAINQNQAIQ